MNLENKKILIHTLTPLFIGSGEDFSPFTFWINSEKNELVEFAEDAFINSLSEAEKNALGRLSLLDLMKLIYKKRSFLSGKVFPVSPQIADTYNNVLAGKANFNKFAIKKPIVNVNSLLPYIPGSSLKGALRTGYLAACQNLTCLPQHNGGAYGRGKEQLDEAAALGGKMSFNSFSTVKVGDCIPVGEVPTLVLYALRCHKRKDKSNIPTMLQAVLGGSVFSGELTLSHADRIKDSFKIKNITDILEKIERYSLSLLADEQVGIKYPALYNLQCIKNEFTNPVYLCRLGGCIGAESHTIDKFRQINIRNPKGKSRILPYSTYTVCATANKHVPQPISFGWCLIEVLDGPANKEVPALRALVAEQNELLQNKSYRKAPASATNLQRMEVVIPKESYDRNATYPARVIEISPKKNRARVQVIGKTKLFTLMEEGTFEVGQQIEIAQIQGETCKLKK